MHECRASRHAIQREQNAWRAAQRDHAFAAHWLTDHTAVTPRAARCIWARSAPAQLAPWARGARPIAARPTPTCRTERAPRPQQNVPVNVSWRLEVHGGVHKL